MVTSEPEEEEVEPVEDKTDDETPEDSEGINDDADLAQLAFRRPLAVAEDEEPIDVTDEAIITEADINRALRNMRKASGTDELNEHVKARERAQDRT